MAKLEKHTRDADHTEGVVRVSGVFLWLFLAVVVLEMAWLAYLTQDEADLVHYMCYGLTFWLGGHGADLLPRSYCAFLQPGLSQPLHMLPQEYPPLTVLLFSLPLLAPLPYYAFVFILLMTLGAGLICWLLARYETRQAALLCALYLLLGAAGVFQERFDLLPAACTLLCLLAAERGHWRGAYLALALGILLKLYPAVLLPVLFLAEQRARGKTQIASWNWSNALLCVGLVVIIMGGFALLNVQNAILSPLTYFLNRPPQIESFAASLIWLGGHFGVPYRISFGFGSLNISSGLLRFISPVNSLLTVGGLLALYWLYLRKRLDLARAFVGLICVLIATGKVFSPQYLIWLVPLLACIASRRQTSRPWLLAWVAISLLTAIIYLAYYARMPDPQFALRFVQQWPGFFELVTLRNLLLFVTALAYICGWWSTRGTAPGE